jgi:hypothetical protein
MRRDDIKKLIGTAFWPKNPPELPPTEGEWSLLKKKFQCQLPPEFHDLQSLMCEYSFQGGFLRIAPRPNKDDILTVCQVEPETGRSWSGDLIPFYDVGNGDYVCLKASECPASGAYYLNHEDDGLEKIHDSLEAWLKDPDWFPG